MPRSEVDSDPEREIGAVSLWLLRATATAFLLVLGWFFVHAIVG